jgi:type I restriction enzyme R subunit
MLCFIPPSAPFHSHKFYGRTFNKDTVDKALAHLMTRGVKVAGGDRLGKTIIFAKNQAHAGFIAERFDANYPHLKGDFSRVITFRTEYAQSLIDNFSNRNKAPHIAISVDMLDTGIDVPEVVNLVFFKLVRSKTKFWQMLGRGTRLCPDLIGPGKDKEFFYLFDYCRNLEFFSQDPETTEGSLGASLGRRLFLSRLELINELDRRTVTEGISDLLAAYDDPSSDRELRHELANRLHIEVSAMNRDNFIVRPKRRLVERYADREAWEVLSGGAFKELAQDIAGLPSELEPEAEEPKRFDLLMLNLQLSLLRSEPGFERRRDQVKAVAGLIEEKSAIPMVAAQMQLIQQLQTDDWWQDVTVVMLERVRKRLRLLVKLIDKKSRTIVYTDFGDEMGEERGFDLPGLTQAGDFERFRAKARSFLREHQDHMTIHKLRMNRPLTETDLLELERMLEQSGIAGPAEISRAREKSHGLGLFVRSLVGLDRGAAKEALAGFLSNKTLSANQIEFVNMIVNHLTEHGIMDAEILYESPFTDITPQGPEGLFTSEQVDEIVLLLDEIRNRAVA